jgi:HAMP domain-containing protein
MSIATAVRGNLGLKVSLKLAVVFVGLTIVGGAVIIYGQTRMMEELTLQKARVAASIGARKYGEMFDDAIDGSLVTVNDVFDRKYVAIKGYSFGNFPKFHTRYDSLTDRAVLVFQDKFLEQKDFVFAVGVDENGYLPTHNTKYQLPLTGEPEKDRVGNRSKRMFDDPVGLAAARSLEPTLLQVYERDTGETMWDVSSPIYVKGKHWGAFRVGVSMQQISAQVRTLLLTLAAMFAAFTVVTLGAMYVVVRMELAPVLALTRAAEQISLGEELDTPIKSAAIDEIGQLTKAIDRLRVSMKAAMSRLGQ